jgi:mono/diheme cytochrome c family protein
MRYSRLWLKQGAGDRADKSTNRPEKRMMKKLIILAAVLGFAAAMTTASAADAKDIFKEKCAKCHGEDGKGQTKMGQKLGIRDYTDAKVQDSFKDEDATKAIKEGVKDKEGKTLMKAPEGLSDDEVKALVTYVRTLKK